MKKIICIFIFISFALISYSQVIISYNDVPIDTTEYCYIDSIDVNYEAQYDNVSYEGEGVLITNSPTKLYELKNGLTYVKFKYNKEHTKCYISKNDVIRMFTYNGILTIIKIDRNKVYDVFEGTNYITWFYKDIKTDRISIIKYDKIRKCIKCFNFK